MNFLPPIRVSAAFGLGLAALLAVGLAGCSGGSRTQIRIVGSSTVYPFTTAVAEQFKRKWTEFPRRSWNLPAPAAVSS